MIAFACGWYVVTYSWFGFSSIIVLSHNCLNLGLNSPLLPLSKTVN
jgi:hypothetical protein